MRLIPILALLSLFFLMVPQTVLAQEERPAKEETAESEEASAEEEASEEEASAEEEEKEATPISMSLKDADLVEVLRSFARIGEFNLVLDPKVSGKVTVELKDVPWDQALEQILKINGLGMEISGGEARIGPRH